MKETLNYLYRNKTLTHAEAKEVLTNIAKGMYNNSQIASFISVYIMRNITVEEIAGFRDALLELCTHVDLSEFDTIDVCGTGGDGKDTFNISTTSAFVIAGAGYKVAKHGNVSATSICGSSNIFETMGYKFSNDQSKLKKEIEQCNLCYMHAPLFNSAMKNVAPVRKELGVKTFFNMLGPMVNPSNVKNQVIGVYSLDVARLYTYLYQQINKNFIIIHSIDGYDEISLTNDFQLKSNHFEMLVAPEKLGFSKKNASELLGGKTIEDSFKIFTNILENNCTQAQKDVVLINSAIGIKVFKPAQSLEDCILEAKESLESKKALNVMKKLIFIQ